MIELRGPGRLFGEPWDDCYKMLAAALGHRYKVLEAQEDWHSPIDSEKVGEQIKKLIWSNSGPLVSFKEFAKRNWKIS